MRRRFGWETAPTLLNDVIGDLLPSAFAVALSPVPIVAVGEAVEEAAEGGP
jgi:hypothetical protein